MPKRRNKRGLLINGPNLARLGTRSPLTYGTKKLSDIESDLSAEAAKMSVQLDTFQSNIEGEIINFVDLNRDSEFLLLNPGALMMSGWALRDCLEDYDGFAIELHISNVFQRETFRQKSVLSDVMNGFLAGFGAASYSLALDAALHAIETTDAE